MNISYLKRHVSYGLHTIVRSFPHPLAPDSPFEIFCGRSDLKDTIFSPKKLLDILESWGYDTVTLPLLFSLKRRLYYAYVPTGRQDFLIGPVRFTAPLHMNRNLDDLSFSEEEFSAVCECEFSEFSSHILLVYNLFARNFLTLDDLVADNCMHKSMEDMLMKNCSDLLFECREENLPHNPYDQELREFSAIEYGDIKMLGESLLEDYKGRIGRLAKDEARHMRNRGIVVVTLASRAAIRGGLLPEIAFSMSDVFIQKLEEESDPNILLNMIHRFEFQYAKMVEDLKSARTGRPKKNQNPRVERCKDYIFKHLHEKIRMQDIAKEVYLNANYLSEIFKQEEGMTVTEFILREKIGLTKNLLTYSPYSYSQIAAYLGFSSQSHLGKAFKKHIGVTLKQYRDRFGVKNF